MIIKISFVLLAYLLGSVPFGLIFAKLKGIDIRKTGSGNTGATNVGRALGKKYAILTYILDMMKGALLVILFRYRILPSNWCLLNPLLLGFVATLGHSHSMFLKFKGGKSVSTGSGALGAYCPLAILFAVITFGIIAIKTKLISLGSIIGTTVALLGSITISLATSSFNKEVLDKGFWPYNYKFLIFAFLIWLIIIVRHASNIRRLSKGEEKKIHY